MTFLASFFLSGVAGWQEMADGEADGVDGLVVVDDKTLDVQLVASDQLFPFSLCRLFAGVFNVEDAAGDPDYFLKPNQLVSGPYQITEVHPSGSQAVFELNPHWWGQKPAITKIIMQAYSDQTAMGIAMENGQLDAAIFGDAKIKNDTIERIGGTPVSYQATSFAYASFKVGVEPVDDINLRKALIHAIDFETMVEVAGQGTKYIWRAPGLVEGFQCYDPATASYTEFNVDLAKEYLAKSRYQTGGQVPKIRMTPERHRFRQHQDVPDYAGSLARPPRHHRRGDQGPPRPATVMMRASSPLIGRVQARSPSTPRSWPRIRSTRTAPPPLASWAVTRM